MILRMKQRYTRPRVDWNWKCLVKHETSWSPNCPYPWVASIICGSSPHECHGYDLVDLESETTAIILNLARSNFKANGGFDKNCLSRISSVSWIWLLCVVDMGNSVTMSCVRSSSCYTPMNLLLTNLKNTKVNFNFIAHLYSKIYNL